MIKDEIALELVEFWIANYPNRLREIPENLKGKISQEEAMNFQKPHRVKGYMSQEALGKLRKELQDRIVSKEGVDALRELSKKIEKKEEKPFYKKPRWIMGLLVVIIVLFFVFGLPKQISIGTGPLGFSWDIKKNQEIKPKILPNYNNLLFSSEGIYNSTYKSNFKLELEVWADPSINAQINIRQTEFSIDKSTYNYLDKSIYGEKLPISTKDISLRINEENDSMSEQHIKKSFNIPSEVNNLWLRPEFASVPIKFKLGEINLTIILRNWGPMKLTERNITVPVYWENK